MFKLMSWQENMAIRVQTKDVVDVATCERKSIKCSMTIKEESECVSEKQVEDFN